MKHIGLGVLIWSLSFACESALTSSTILLAGGGTVLPTQSSNIPLTGLIPLANYNVICYLDNTSPFVVVRLDVNFASSPGNVSLVSVNGITGTQSQLNVGRNIALISGNFANPSMANLVITNLDQSNSFNVNNCFATAVIG